MAVLRWIGEPLSEGGVTECRFDLEREAGHVPRILWTPTQHDHPVPLVLLGHGRDGHKRADQQLRNLTTIDAHRVAYMGFSMGTRFGLPCVAAAGNRLCCAVLGKWGMRLGFAASAIVTREMANTAQRFTQDAPKITVPVLFHMQWDDELLARDGQLELFDLLGAQDKRLIAFPGPHGTAAPAAVDTWCAFVMQHLAV